MCTFTQCCWTDWLVAAQLKLAPWCWSDLAANCWPVHSNVSLQPVCCEWEQAEPSSSYLELRAFIVAQLTNYKRFCWICVGAHVVCVWFIACRAQWLGSRWREQPLSGRLELSGAPVWTRPPSAATGSRRRQDVHASPRYKTNAPRGSPPSFLLNYLFFFSDVVRNLWL